MIEKIMDYKKVILVAIATIVAVSLAIISGIGEVKESIQTEIIEKDIIIVVDTIATDTIK